MTNRHLVTAAILAGVGGGMALSATPANAQETGLIPIRVKAGGFFPGGSGKSFSGSTHLAAEAEVLLPKLLPLGAGTTGISLGYSRGKRNGNTLQMVPLTIGKTFAPPNPVGGVTGYLYFGGGLGPYFLKASGGGTSDSKTTIGGYGVVGYQLPNKFFVEGKYHLVGKVAGVKPSGFALLVGRSF